MRNFARMKPLSLSEFQALVKGELERAMPLTYWVIAEVSELRVNYAGHCYLQLVEKQERTQQPRAAVSAVAWRSTWGSVAAHFRAMVGRDIAAGMKLLLRVVVSYHELYGFSLVISDIDPSYTVGEVVRERERTIAQLRADGVFDMNRQLRLPTPLQRIAVISSRTAAGYQDFMQELQRWAYRFDTELFEAVMQGEAAEDSIIAALDAIAESVKFFDTLVIIRGGGAQSDLSCFDSYRLCSHVAQFPLPVLTGIGHDKDRSIVDEVAHTALKTPTAVAGFLVERMAALDEYLLDLERRIGQSALRGLAARQARLEYLAGRVEASDPQRILSLGFAVVRSDGKALKAAAKVAEGTPLEITLARGSLKAKVEKK